MQKNSSPLNSAIRLQEARIEGIGHAIANEKDIRLEVLRLDRVHPVISGNKWFKLKHYLAEAIAQGHSTVLSFGGAYSNHLHALAFAAHAAGLDSVGIVRGEAATSLTPTLRDVVTLGMRLHFADRREYDDPLQRAALAQPYHAYIIPEGGYGPLGVKGAGEIHSLFSEANYSHIALAAGTTTMLAGLLGRSGLQVEWLALPVVKDLQDLQLRLSVLLHAPLPDRLKWLDGYPFGGYGHYNNDLISFMKKFYSDHSIPSDLIYTGKLFYAIDDLIKKNYFPSGSRILVIHSGGLQGNRSLPHLGF